MSDLAYHKVDGKGPGLVFLGGFRSDMTGTKASFLQDLCEEQGQSFVRFDYRGHGASSDTFENGTFGDWLADALSILDHLTQGPQVLIGSSMGGWIMLQAALKRPKKVCGLIGIASAPDFTRDMWDYFTSEQRDQQGLRDAVAVAGRLDGVIAGLAAAHIEEQDRRLR